MTTKLANLKSTVQLSIMVFHFLTFEIIAYVVDKLVVLICRAFEIEDGVFQSVL